MKDLICRVADDFGLTPEEREQEIPSGGTTLIASRVHWAKTYLKQAGLLEQPKRGVVQISQRGRTVLASSPVRINVGFLHQFEEFRAFLGKTNATALLNQTATNSDSMDQPSSTPEEQIAVASSTLSAALRDALLARILDGTPIFFERIIVDLLLAMGCGGSRKDAGEHLGRTGDGGIDGIIHEDRLGLDRVYLQAKRYRPGNAVGSEAVQAFVGALVGRGAQKGVLITTSSFSRAAMDVVRQSGSLRLVLIDGDLLTDLMVRFNVGVRVSETIEIKRVDADYFENAEGE